MGSCKAVVIQCDQTGETFILKHGDEIGKSPRGYTQKFNANSGAPLRDAWKVAYRAGWRSFSKRDADGNFRRISAPPTENPGRRGPRWTAGEWVTAPDVDPDPPISVVGRIELERRRKYQQMTPSCGPIECAQACVNGEEHCPYLYAASHGLEMSDLVARLAQLEEIVHREKEATHG